MGKNLPQTRQDRTGGKWVEHTRKINRQNPSTCGQKNGRWGTIGGKLAENEPKIGEIPPKVAVLSCRGTDKLFVWHFPALCLCIYGLSKRCSTQSTATNAGPSWNPDNTAAVQAEERERERARGERGRERRSSFLRPRLPPPPPHTPLFPPSPPPDSPGAISN